MPLQSLVDLISDSTKELLDNLSAGADHSVLGLQRSARLPVLAAIHRELRTPIVLLTDRTDHALSQLDELALWAPETPRLLFPEPNPLFYEKAPWGENTRRDRLTVLTTLTGYLIPGVRKPAIHPLIIVPARALMSRTIPRREFLKATRTLHAGQEIGLDDLLRNWFNLGYERVNTVLASGQYARRGGILDLWPPANSLPVRIELFGDQIDTLRPFDPATQRTFKSGEKETQERMLVSPAREYLSGQNQTAEVSQDESEVNEFYLPIYHPTLASVLDYLPGKSLVMVDDYQALQDAVNEIEEQCLNLRQEAIQIGNIPADFPVPYLGWNEIEDSLQSHQCIKLGPVFNAFEAAKTGSDLSGRFAPEPRFGGRLKPFIDHLIGQAASENPTVVVSRQKSRLEELWKDVQVQVSHPNDALDGKIRPSTLFDLPPVSFIQGSLAEGWIFSHPSGKSLHLFTDGEIFGIRPPEPRQHRRFSAEDPEAAYADLQAGDYVVHVDHGIGIFVGLVERTIDGMEREYLCIEYADEAQLFVPVYQADRLTRYLGPDNRMPTLSRLGSAEWRSVKSHVKEAVQEVAEELLNLYAKRSVVTGYAFTQDTVWQQELETSFPYVETEDQIRVLNEVKRDMEKALPMDRLICGDVGYGKTEVALRAAFKCVMESKQVAILVPTTILAQQHYDTFCQRLSAFPVEVEMLSRFRSSAEQRQILNRLKRGAIDIIIGTHRLLSSDVEFKDMGLLVIDEEQRFGVTHKEKLKQMRTEVDVMTLTATPIPRTLYMALTGVRDISTINTPPEERLPVITHVGPYTPDIVRKAILRELERGGQVFFVHNRVQTIGAMRIHLEKLTPEARIAVAHGQMPENELSVRMKQFTNGEIDVLLSTSIIESGLDIPNANTLVVDRADTFGLAQLYQLRGRVGRGAQRAYAYFFRHARKIPTQEGRQRLETIAENTQLGAGFSIAMRDLEIRGTGDILGTRQSGHVAAVGFHLYTRLLSEAVRQLRKSSEISVSETAEAISVEESLQVSVDLPLPINIPAAYVAEKNMRLRLYRRLANIRSLTELDSLEDEFKDRFGPLPEAVQNMFFQLKVKILAEKAGLASVSIENSQLALRYADGTLPPSLGELDPVARVGKTTIWLPYASLDNWADILVETLQYLRAIHQPESHPEMF